jgi:hypothetical protein
MQQNLFCIVTDASPEKAREFVAGKRFLSAYQMNV